MISAQKYEELVDNKLDWEEVCTYCGEVTSFDEEKDEKNVLCRCGNIIRHG